MSAASDPGKLAVREAPRPKPKRVYKTVSIAEADGGWRVLLDRTTLATPMRKPLIVPTKALAETIAAEWDAQVEHVDPETMPVMRLMATAIDQVVPARATIVEELMRYADTDLLCYRAAHPAMLRKRQDEAWQPVLDWVHSTCGTEFVVVSGIIPAVQDAANIAKLRAAIGALDDLRLTAFQAAAAVTSSLTLSLALVHGRLSPADAFTASQLDELYQTEMWGEDELAAQRRANIAADIDAIGRFLQLIAN